MPLSGKELLKIYYKNGWVFIRQKGSHVRVGKGEFKESIPMHKEIKKGLEQKLLKKLTESSR